MNVKSEIGDLMVWKFTTTHSANADLISLFPNVSLHPRLARRFPKFLKVKAKDPRITLFMSFGFKDDYSKGFIDYLKTRQYGVERWANSNYNTEDIEDLKAKNVEVYTDFNLDEIDLNQVTVQHK